MTSPKLQPWQERMIDAVRQGKELKIMMSGRGVGKSHLSAQAFKRLMDDINHSPVENLILSEGTVFGARFFCVEPVGGSWLDMETWCLDTFGSASNIWDMQNNNYEVGRWYMNDRKFWFRNERDRNWFTIKWSR